MSPNHAPVALIPLLTNQFHGFKATEKPRDIRLGCDHAFTNSGAGESFGLRPTKNAKDIVLS